MLEFQRTQRFAQEIFSAARVSSSPLGHTGVGDHMNLFYHGHGRRPPYFEGWYLKLQSPRGQSLALIPALHTAPSGTRRASLQVISQKAAW